MFNEFKRILLVIYIKNITSHDTLISMLIDNIKSQLITLFCRFKSQTHSGASKRFIKLSDGNFLRRKAGRNHNFSKKDAAGRSNIRTPIVTSRAQSDFIRNLSV